MESSFVPSYTLSVVYKGDPIRQTVKGARRALSAQVVVKNRCCLFSVSATPGSSSPVPDPQLCTRLISDGREINPAWLVTEVLSYDVKGECLAYEVDCRLKELSGNNDAVFWIEFWLADSHDTPITGVSYSEPIWVVSKKPAGEKRQEPPSRKRTVDMVKKEDGEGLEVQEQLPEQAVESQSYEARLEAKIDRILQFHQDKKRRTEPTSNFADAFAQLGQDHSQRLLFFTEFAKANPDAFKELASHVHSVLQSPPSPAPLESEIGWSSRQVDSDEQEPEHDYYFR